MNGKAKSGGGAAAGRRNAHAAPLNKLADASADSAERSAEEATTAGERSREADSMMVKLQEKLADQSREFAFLSMFLREEEELRKRAEAQAKWLGEVAKLLLRAATTAWPRRLSAASLETMLKEQGLFDASAYLDRNPDVAGAGMSPLQHYLLYGIAEERRRSSEDGEGGW